MHTEKQLDLARQHIEHLKKEKEQLEKQLRRERNMRMVLAESNKDLEAADAKLSTYQRALEILVNYPKKTLFLRKEKNRPFIEGYNTAIDDMRSFIEKKL